MVFIVSGCELIETNPQKAGLRPYMVSTGGGGGGSGSYCTDSDGGLDYYTRGDCVDSHHANPMNDGCIESNGDNDGFLREITCSDSGNGCVMNDYECPYGCFQGACLYEPLEVTYQGVLNILNSCEIHDEQECVDAHYSDWYNECTSCDQICGFSEKTCVAASRGRPEEDIPADPVSDFYEAFDCASGTSIVQYNLFCTCCSP